MQRHKLSQSIAQKTHKLPLLRAHNCMHLCSGDTVGAFIEFPQSFEDTPVSFGHNQTSKSAMPSQWISNKILEIATLCETLSFSERPLIVPVPDAILTDQHSLDACLKAATQTRLCNQELSLELTDAAITLHPEEAHAFVHAFRRKGFRVSVDARKSWSNELPGQDWLMVDTLRFNAKDLEANPDIETLIAVAVSAGVAIVAERAYWREGEYLARLGIDYGLYPRTDS